MQPHKIGSFRTRGRGMRRRGAGRGAEELFSESKSVGPLRSSSRSRVGQPGQPIVHLCFLSTACFFGLESRLL